MRRPEARLTFLQLHRATWTQPGCPLLNPVMCNTLEGFGAYLWTPSLLTAPAKQVARTCRNSTSELKCDLCSFDWQELNDRATRRLWDMVKSCRFQELHCTLDDFESVCNPWLLPLNFNPFSSLTVAVGQCCLREVSRNLLICINFPLLKNQT